MNKVKNSTVLILVLLIASFFRLIGLNWDQGQFFHPDERFLNMTIQELQLPKNLLEYFDPQQSTLNPRHIGRNFYVYGNFPITFSKLTNEFLNNKSLTAITITGRVLSAAADLMVVFLIYLTVFLLEKNLKDKRLAIDPRSKFWAALIYALMVLPIQQSHFFTTDTFLNLFVFASFYFSLKYFFEKKDLYIISAGLFFGLALASKITAISILPLNMSLLILPDVWPLKKQLAKKKILKNCKKILLLILLFVSTAYLVLRLTSPYMFQTASLLDFNLNREFLADLTELKSFSNDDTWYPPAIQWMNRSNFFGLKNLIVYGVGLISSLLSIWGIAIIIKRIFSLFKKVNVQKYLLVLALIIFWLGSFLIYYSQQFVQSIRYYLLIYPFLAIFAGIACSVLLKNKKSRLKLTIALLLSIAIWPLMFISVYIKDHSRIQASAWIYQHIPSGSTILSEHWDDPLPVSLATFNEPYQNYQLPVFDPDNQQKWAEIIAALNRADYYILSSNRAWGSIIRVPEKYPQMSQFYQDLLAGRSNYKLIAQFNSFPSLEYLGINFSINDSWADEAFTVYDHPQVLIFQKIQ